MHVILKLSAPNEEYLKALAEKLLAQNLAACIQIIGPVKSLYNWQDKMEEAKEWLAEIKTIYSHFEKIKEEILKTHDYELPEIIVLKIEDGHSSYLNWIEKECS